MQWQRFKPDNAPQNEIFLLAVGNDVFFARVNGKRLATRYAYTDALETEPRSHIEVFMNNLCKRNIIPFWAPFQMPQWS